MNMRILITGFLVSVLLLSCTSHEKKIQEVLALRQMSDLGTAEYIVTKIIKASDDQTWYKIGDRKILMSCKAHIIAGVDLSILTEKDVSINGKEIKISLPEAHVIALNINPNDIKQEYEEVDPLRMKFDAAERNGLAIQAERQIRSSIDSLGILKTAGEHATLFIETFLRRLGYEHVVILTKQKS